MSTPMPKHHDPYRPPSQVREREKEETEPASAKGTMRGAPAILKQSVEPTTELQAAMMDTPFEEPPDSAPFEDPKQDIFGIGYGV